MNKETETKEVEYNRKRIIHKAKEYGKSTKCRCGKKDWNTVPLYEYGDPFMPSSVILKCKHCPHTITFAKADIESAKSFARDMKAKGFKKAPAGAEDDLISKWT